MASTTPVKTFGTSTLLAWQDIASAAQVISSPLSVATVFAAAFAISVARLTGSAFTAGAPNIRIEAQTISGGPWIPLWTYQPQIGASIAATTLNGAITAGASTFVVTSASNIAAGDVLFLGHTSDPTKYELVRVKSVSGTTITPEENVLNAHDNGCLITDQAEMIFPTLDLRAYSNVRAVADNVGSGQGIKVQVLASLFTNLTSA